MATPTDGPAPVESHRVHRVGYSDLDGRRNAFKMGLQETEEGWFLYLGHFWHNGVSIVDVTDPAEPTYEGFLPAPPSTSASQVQVADGLLLTNLEPAFPSHPFHEPDVEATTGVQLWDVGTDPRSPELRSTYEIPGGGTHRNHYHGGDYAYLTAQPEGYDGHVPLVLDVSDPAHPEEVGRASWPGQAPGESFAHPSEAAADLHGPPYPDDAEDPEYAYLPYGGAGMVTADVSDPTDPELVHRFDNGHFGDTPVGVHSAVPHPGSDVVWTSTETTSEGAAGTWNFVAAVDKSEPGSERVCSVLPTPTPEPDLPYDSYYEKGARFGPHNTHHWQYTDEYHRPDDVLAWTWFSAGLRLFDVSDPLAPEEVGYYVPEDPDEHAPGAGAPSDPITSTESVLIDRRGFLYVTDKNHGLQVVESDLL